MKVPIVVCVDDSGANEAAVAWAMHRAAAMKLPVDLVHAVDDRWTSQSLAYNEMAKKEANELLGKAKAHAAGVEPGVDVQTLLISGSPGMPSASGPRRRRS
ncbi:universal stress protein [Arthrobacter sp. KNU-44]|uniref:universal stress protein n=1 Tax=unclassified Arthrobacter TaxID=235627 RepID=UPI003F41DAFC